jgi:glycosyltransferase involved in cell wall biosynthesis
MNDAQNRNKMLVIMDWQPPNNWVFQKELCQYFDTEICFGQAPKSFQSQIEKIVSLWKSYVFTAIRALFKIKSYDVAYAWHAVIGLVFAALCRFFRLRRVRIVVAQLIVPSKNDSIAQRAKLAFTRYALKRIELVIAYSHVEVEQFKNEYENGFTKFVFAPLGIDLPPNDGKPDKGYIFSGGRSNRDYETLIRAVAPFKTSLHIAAQRFNIGSLDIPSNVTVHYDAFGDEFLSLLRGAALVVIPLDRVNESSGQLVLLQAMALGKAIIVTENRGISDYYLAGETATLSPPHDPAALSALIKKLMANPKERARLGRVAIKHANQFTLQKQAERVAGIINTMMTRRNK